MTNSLYADQIMALAKQVPGKEHLDQPRATISMDNPLCGDRITIDVDWNDANQTLTQVAHKVRGCALCVAAANLISQELPGKTLAEIAQAEILLEELLQNNPETVTGDWQYLEVFRPVHNNKSRHECVLLPFRALNKALHP